MTPTTPGPYRFRSFPDESWQPVEVIKDGRELLVRFPPLDGDEGADLLLEDLTGEFQPPA